MKPSLPRYWPALLAAMALGVALVAYAAVSFFHRNTPVAIIPTGANLALVENVGQLDPQVRFQAWGARRTLWLADDGIWITVWQKGAPTQGLQRLEPALSLRLTFIGANPHPKMEPFGRLDARVDYLMAGGKHIEAPLWSGVRYVELYPGLDLEIGGAADDCGWRLVAHNGAPSPTTAGGSTGWSWPASAVALRVEGAQMLSLSGPKAHPYISLTTTAGELGLPLLRAVGADGLPLDAAQLDDRSRAGGQVSGNVIAGPFAPGGVVTIPAMDLLYDTQAGCTGGPDANYLLSWADASSPPKEVGPRDLRPGEPVVMRFSPGNCRPDAVFVVGNSAPPTPTPTITPSPSTTPSVTPTLTPSLTPTRTPIPSVTPTWTNSPTYTPTPTCTPSVTPTPTWTNTPSVTPTRTLTPTPTTIASHTPTATVGATATTAPSNTPEPPTATTAPSNTPEPPTATTAPSHTPEPPTATTAPSNTPEPPAATGEPLATE